MSVKCMKKILYERNVINTSGFAGDMLAQAIISYGPPLKRRISG